MGASEVLGAITLIVTVLQGLDASSARASSARTDAVRALSDAVTRTQQCVGSDNSAPGTDLELTNLWFKASAAFRAAGDDELAHLCQIKGDYWTDPNSWSKDRVYDAGISLRAMQRELRRLLANVG